MSAQRDVQETLAKDPPKPGTSTTALLLSPTGHVEHVMYGVDDGETFWLHTEPGAHAWVAWYSETDPRSAYVTRIPAN